MALVTCELHATRRISTAVGLCTESTSAKSVLSPGRRVARMAGLTVRDEDGHDPRPLDRSFRQEVENAPK